MAALAVVPNFRRIQGPAVGEDAAGNAIGPNYSLYEGDIYDIPASVVVVDTNIFIIADYSEFRRRRRNRWIDGAGAAGQVSTTEIYSWANYYHPPPNESFDLVSGRTALTDGKICSLSRVSLHAIS